MTHSHQVVTPHLSIHDTESHPALCPWTGGLIQIRSLLFLLACSEALHHFKNCEYHYGSDSYQTLLKKLWASLWLRSCLTLYPQRWLSYNQLTSLPEDVFQGLSSLTYLWVFAILSSIKFSAWQTSFLQSIFTTQTHEDEIHQLAGIFCPHENGSHHLQLIITEWCNICMHVCM